jgi:hypothetical protein
MSPKDETNLRKFIRSEQQNVPPMGQELEDWKDQALKLYEDFVPIFNSRWSAAAIKEKIRDEVEDQTKKYASVRIALNKRHKNDVDWLDDLQLFMGQERLKDYITANPGLSRERMESAKSDVYVKRRDDGRDALPKGNGLYESSDSDYEGEGIGDILTRVKKIKDVAVGLVSGRREFTPSSRAVLERYGNDPYTRVLVCRKALDSNLLKFIKMTKQGVPYDKLYHLSIRFQMPDGKWLRLDKREDLQASIESAIPPETTCIPVRVGSSAPRTVNEILAKTLKAVGEERFYKYRSTSYNCQRFIADIIQSNDMSTDMSFIMQDVKGLVPSWVDSLANVATDAKARLNLIMQGRGYDCEDCEGGYHCDNEVSYTETNPSNQGRYFAAAVNQQNNAYTQEPSSAAFNANMRHEQRRADTGLTAGGAFPQYPYNATQGFIKGFGQSEPLFAQIPHRTKTDQDYYKLDDVNGVYMKSLNTFD